MEIEQKKLLEKICNAMLCMTRQCWEAGIAAQALMEAGEEERLELMIHDIVLRQTADGRLCNVENTPALTDSAFCIPAVWLTGVRTGNEALKEAAMKNTDFLLHRSERTESGYLCHIRGLTELWADTCAFTPYALALTGYFDEGYRQMTGLLDRLYDEKTGLYFHRWDEEKKEFVRAEPWASGNGWILTGLLRLLSVCPKDRETEKADLEDRFVRLVEAVLKTKTPDGGFYDVLTDPSSFKETTSAAMISYALFRGVKEGRLPKEYRRQAEEIRTFVIGKILPSGMVIDAASSPTFDRPGTSVECQAHVMLLLSA